jgi:MoaA/NifB/PqqE/SkfB family radical SAM enzyme
MDSKTANLPEEVSTGEWISFFDQLKKDFGNKVTIQITGGEPLLRTDLFKILPHLNRLGFRVSMASNGLLMDEKNIIELKKFITGLSISLDGFKESHDYLRNANTFKKTVENIKKLKKLGFKDIMIKTAVCKKNFGELKNFYKLIQDLRVDNWHIFAMEPAGRGQTNIKDILTKKEYIQLCDFIDELKKDKKKNLKIIFDEQSDLYLDEKTCNCNKYKLCHAGISSCVVLYNGDIASCIQTNRTTDYGNIKNADFKKIWYNGFQENRSEKYKNCQNHYFN